MAKILGFGFDTVGGAPYVRGAMAGDDLDPKALATPYDLNVPGRVLEVKRALAAVGEADQGKETLWRLLTPDDVWDDAVANEYVIFVSRWKGRLTCYPFPMLQFAMGSVHPTFTGLLMLDAAYRRVGGGTLAALRFCETGPASTGSMVQLETFLAGQPLSAGATVPLLRKSVEQVKVAPSGAVVHPVPPADGDATLLAQYTSIEQAMQQMWVSLTKAVTDDARILSVQALDQAMRRRDDLAKQIIAKAGGRQGTTEVENVGRCDPPLVWSKATGKCGSAIEPPANQAAVTPGGVALLAAGLGLVVWAVRKPPSARRAHR